MVIIIIHINNNIIIIIIIYIFIWRQYAQGLRGADFKSSYYRQRQIEKSLVLS